MNNKKVLTKVTKIILFLSFIPFLFLIGYSLYHSIFGYDVYTMILPQYLRTIYGMDAFQEVFLWTALALCFIPVLPICFLYQIIYLIIHLVKNHRKKSSM